MSAYDIAFLLGYPEISGGTNVILEHAGGLTRLGHRVSIVTERPCDPRRLSWKPEAAGLPLLCHDDCAGRRFDVSIATWWRSVFDLPHVPARWYAYFCQSIESRFFSEQEADLKALVDYTYRQPLPVVTEASWIARYLGEHYGRQVTVVRNGIDKRVFRPDGDALGPRPGQGLRVLVEGSLGVAFKRVEQAVRLCQLGGMKDIWLLTPTECEGYPGVQRVLSKVPMSQVGGVYRSCDVLVKLSVVEGMFGPPLEMMHCGGTAITSDVTGHDEYMRHGENGLVVPLGREMEVIDHLRRLSSDRAFLDKLKAGARETAAAWPDWRASVAEMERFIVSVVRREPTQAQGQTDAMQALRAALMLAGPLEVAVRRGYSGRQLLNMLRRKIKPGLIRKVPGLGRLGSCRTPATAHLPPPAAPVPPLPGGGLLPRRPSYRVCFVGDERTHRAHTPSRGDRMEAHFVHVAGRVGNEELSAIGAFGPDITFVFEPDRLTPAVSDRLPGVVVGYGWRGLSAGAIRRYRTLFPAGNGARAVLFLADADAVPDLRRQGINAPGSFLLPTDGAVFARADDLEQWCSRQIPLLYVGEATRRNRDFLAAAAEFPGFVHISNRAGDQAVRAVLAGTRMVLHLPGPADAGLDAAKVIRDMMSGCLVLGGRFAPDYGLMPGEHYLFCPSPEDLASFVSRQMTVPEVFEVTRRVGMAHAAAFDARRWYVPIIEQYLCRPPEGKSGDR